MSDVERRVQEIAGFLVGHVGCCVKHGRAYELARALAYEGPCDDAAHDAEVAARTLREAADVADESSLVGTGPSIRPERVADWLRARADRLAALHAREAEG